MRARFLGACVALALLAGAVGTSAQSTSTADAQKGKDQQPPRQVKVAIDPRSSGGMEAMLLTNGFRNVCPNVSIIRDEPEAEYVVFASGACPGFLCHWYITVYDKQGKVVFATDKHDGKNTSQKYLKFDPAGRPSDDLVVYARALEDDRWRRSSSCLAACFFLYTTVSTGW